MDDLRVNSQLVIPSAELQWRFSKASGPGGQNVNKTNSRVELIFDLNATSALGPFRKKRLLNQLQHHLVAGCVRVVAAEERSQYQNRQLALSRLAYFLRMGLEAVPKTRKPTKPSQAAKKRRLQAKKLRGELKRTRQSKPSLDA